MKKLKPEYVRLDQNRRLYGLSRPIVALTGGIGTGKSTVSEIFKTHGLSVLDADLLVKSIYAGDEAKDFIRTELPSAWAKDKIDFPKLREIVFQNNAIKTSIENFIYPRLRAALLQESSKVQDQNFILYDVPLLFERQLDALVDLKIVVYAPRSLQLARLVERDKTDTDLAEKILASQMDIEAKKTKADIVITNCGNIQELKARVDEVLREILI